MTRARWFPTRGRPRSSLVKVSNTRTQLVEAELYRLANERVRYAVERMSWPLWHDTKRSVLSDVDLWFTDSLVDSMILHARNVCAFLLNERPRADSSFATDVVADHYFDVGWSGRPDYLLGSDRGQHDEMMQEINRRLAHITSHGLWNRHGGIEMFHWSDITKWLPEVLIGFGKFVDDLEVAHRNRAEWFDWSRDIVEKAKE